MKIYHLFFFLLFFSSIQAKETIMICTTPEAGSLEKQAAEVLSGNLKEIYPKTTFQLTDKLTKIPSIIIGTYKELSKNSELAGYIRQPKDGGFIITSAAQSGNIKEIIIGSTPRSLLDAVYTLSEKLGFGYYLSYDIKPESKAKINFPDWEMEDFPLVKERIVFNWHNFLSGCSGWNFSEWKKWIDQSSKMKYNTIMVHAYGNNPMFQFEMNGLQKPVGYMNTSISGRDWGGQHVNDVRRLPGGFVFNDPVLGPDAARVPDNQRVDAATGLMKQVTKYAQSQGMGIIFAYDVDTWSSNPQNIILSLPESARFQSGSFWLANPEKPEGYAFYKTQLEKLIKDYPEITKIAIWVRANKTPWRTIKKNELPSGWEKEYASLLEREWQLLDNDISVTTFALSKVVVAWQKAMKELGLQHIELMFGSWGWDNMVPSNYIIPKNVTFIPLDSRINFDYKSTQKKLEEIGKTRKLIPIVWPHHDDHRYIGRPYTPYPRFADMLKERNAAGFGIIHWTTFPLDLYFKSAGRQVWNANKNEELKTTIHDFVTKHWGNQAPVLDEYLYSWITQGPMFGRETGNHFMDIGKIQHGEELENPDSIISKANKRLEMLKQVDRKKLSGNIPLLECFEGMEAFYVDFFQNNKSFNQAYNYLKKDDVKNAQIEIQKTNCEKLIELYAKTVQKGPFTSGEKSLTFSMGTRLLPDFVNIKQRVGTSPVRYRFGTTQHDDLAQNPGKYTWYMDESQQLWIVLGKKELESKYSAGYKEANNFITTNKPVYVDLKTISGNELPEKNYVVTLECIAGKEAPKMEVYTITNKTEQKKEISSEKKSDVYQIKFNVNVDKNTNRIKISPLEEIKIQSLVIQ